MTILEEYKGLFEKCFYSKIEIKTNKLFELWFDCSLLEESIAGPLYSIYTKGNCDYVYTRNDENFKDVHNPIDLKIWLEKIINCIEIKFNNYEVNSIDEKKDITLINNKIDQYYEIVRMAIEVESKRKII